MTKEVNIGEKIIIMAVDTLVYFASAFKLASYLIEPECWDKCMCDIGKLERL